MASNQTPEPSAAGAPEDAAVWRLSLGDQEQTERLAAEVARMLGSGDLVTLSGDLGAGKTTFARALIRSITGDPDLAVPSPTFTLMQTYDGPDFPIVHADLYRIERESELAELGWDEAGSDALVVVEWAERAGALLSADRLDVALHLDIASGLEHRDVVIRATGSVVPRLARARAIEALLHTAGWSDAQRAFMIGDASTRAYERLTRPDGATAILMIAPPRPPGPAVRAGKPYPAIARLSQHIDAFIAVDRALRGHGFSAPEIYAADREVGLAILEDLGSEPVVDADGPMPERYGEAVGLLARLHGLELPSVLPLDDAATYAIPPYDLDALMIEVELLLEWFAPYVAKVTLPASTRMAFVGAWKSVLSQLVAASPPTWTLRDYHSPNLIWQPQRSGLARVGLIDFQDCVMGPPAYDLAALLQDARVTLPDALELKLLGQYAQLRRRADPAFDMAAFAQTYAITGAQRATKILGLFARLDRRDGKPHYLAHLPRMQHYLAKGVDHPVLAELKAWYEAHLPTLLEPMA